MKKLYHLFIVAVVYCIQAIDQPDWVQYYYLVDTYQYSHLVVHTPQFVCYDDYCSSKGIDLDNDEVGGLISLDVAAEQEVFEDALIRSNLYTVRQSPNTIEVSF